MRLFSLFPIKVNNASAFGIVCARSHSICGKQISSGAGFFPPRQFQLYQSLQQGNASARQTTAAFSSKIDLQHGSLSRCTTSNHNHFNDYQIRQNNMLCFNFLLDERIATNIEPIPSTYAILPDRSNVSESQRHAMDDALDKVAVAVATLHRAGPHYKQMSEIFWFFCAGSWCRTRFDEQVMKSKKNLPGSSTEVGSGKRGVSMDVAFAEEKMHEALAVLQRDGLQGDVQDLLWAIEVYQSGKLWW